MIILYASQRCRGAAANVPQGKRVAVIGNGSSGIQIVPGMLPDVVHIDHYVRGRTWISPTFARHEVDKRGAELGNCEEESVSAATDADQEQSPLPRKKSRNSRKTTSHIKSSAKVDPLTASLDFADHPAIELDLQSIHGATIMGTPEQVMGQEFFYQNMKRRLAKDPKLLDDLVPPFPPACRRLTPGPGYLEALTDEKVDVIWTPIQKVDATGIVTADGKHRSIDVLVCATGFDTTYTPRFPMTGRDGVPLSNRWKETPETYISLAVDHFPNYFICLGPNAGLGEGNLLVLIEREIDYFVECVKKMQRDNIKAMDVRADAVTRFTKHCDQYFKRTVFGTKCRSWYKGGTEEGRVTALWPGRYPLRVSGFLHVVDANTG